MTELQDYQIDVGEHRYSRVSVEAKLTAVTDENTPESVRQYTSAVAEQIWQNVDGNPDLQQVRFVLDAEGGNKNWDYMPREQLVTAHRTAIFKPVNMDHVLEEYDSLVDNSKDSDPPVRNTIFGVITHAALADADGTLLSEKAIAKLDLTDDMNRPEEERLTIVAWANLYGFYFPQTVSEFLEAANDEAMSVSMERWIAEKDYLVWNNDQWQPHSETAAQTNGYAKAWAHHTEVNGHPVWRRTLKAVYAGVAGTRRPAQPLCHFLPSDLGDQTRAAASDENLQDLLKRHSQVHEAFCVSTVDEQARLIDEHMRLTKAIAAYTGAI